MKKQLIIYGSRYGSTKRYAERLAEMTGLEAVEYKAVKDLGDYDRIVYLGSLYAGGVTGLKQTVGKMSPQQELIVSTVGLADPTDASNVAHIRQSIKGQIPAHFYDESRLFHLRGAIDYSHLSFGHNLMMKMFHSMMLKKPEAELTADAKAMLETYGKQVDFVDFSSLQPIVDKIK